ncbi:hypothetical protein FSP39_008554 [Pinctada imbricata]|uniref:Uncharacterized protein n=1 Tax=Pinctada imbricata TaxID=66713 RepID=A0AA89C5M9_PINIB|nr:hypothetical protein FSP39_008554 [Pinctada imbricata]
MTHLNTVFIDQFPFLQTFSIAGFAEQISTIWRNFQEFQCIKGGVWVGGALLVVGLLLAVILGVVKGFQRLLKTEDDLSVSKGKSTSTHHIIELEESKLEESNPGTSDGDQLQNNETDGEEKPYFKRVVYQSKYNPKNKKKSSRRKKKSLLRSLRRLSRMSDSSDEDYENAYIS